MRQCPESRQTLLLSATLPPPVERLARRTGLSKTAAVEQAVDRMLKELAAPGEGSARMAALLAQLDRIPDRPDTTDPLPWDEHGLPA